MSDKRVIEQPISNDVFGDDWFLKDSPQRGTTRISKSDFLRAMSEGFEGIVELTQAEYDALPSTKYNDGILYAIKDSTDLIAVLNGNICNVIWSTTGTYSEGDYVLKDSALYVCAVTTATTGTWVDAEWTRTSMVEMVLDELDDIPDRLDAIEEMEPAWTMKATLPNLPKPIATIPDGADAPIDSLKASIVGVQDLHGYDKPWVGGAGKNKGKLSADFEGSGQNVGVKSYTDNGATISTPTASYARQGFVFNLPNGNYTISCYAHGSGYNRILYGTQDAAWASTSPGFSGYQIISETKTKYTKTINVTDGVLFFGLYINTTPLDTSAYITVDEFMIELGSTATEFEPYSNICPISGWTGCEVNKSGKNHVHFDDNKIFSQQKCTVTYTDDGLIATATGNFARVGYRFNVKQGETYTFSFKGFGDAQYKNVYINMDDAWNGGERLALTSTEDSYSATFTVTSNICYIGVYITSTGTSGSVTLKNIQLEMGSTASEYVPYIEPNTYTIPFKDSSDNPINVYRGTIDVSTGVATFTHKLITLNGSENWILVVDYVNRFYLASSYNDGLNTANSKISNCLTPTSWGIERYSFGFRSNGEVYVTLDNTASQISVNDFKAWISNNNLEIAYELATPIVMQFDPIALRSDGVTNISVDCGEVTELKYIRDATTTINDILARLEALEG